MHRHRDVLESPTVAETEMNQRLSDYVLSWDKLSEEIPLISWNKF